MFSLNPEIFLSFFRRNDLVNVFLSEIRGSFRLLRSMPMRSVVRINHLRWAFHSKPIRWSSNSRIMCLWSEFPLSVDGWVDAGLFSVIVKIASGKSGSAGGGSGGRIPEQIWKSGGPETPFLRISFKCSANDWRLHWLSVPHLDYRHWIPGSTLPFLLNFPNFSPKKKILRSANPLRRFQERSAFVNRPF